MPPETITKRTLRNQRSKNNLKEPRHLEDCIIINRSCIGDWALANDGLRLLLKDSIEDQFEDRVIIFATDEGLKHLTEAETWMFDGNFALAHSIFQQLYVIRVKIHDLYITSNYSILFVRKKRKLLMNICYNRYLMHAIIKTCTQTLLMFILTLKRQL
ncbi:uncharacterized protein LOC111042374 [Myzus persicae]|uniref:uncharacterized protein LOC111042374 n=1 Tax=Myzus persicae TaxID=13164 RepID=UPI000B9351C1|nr:uncharacterized protein LOC111042374 [Myzus persicae]